MAQGQCVQTHKADTSDRDGESRVVMGFLWFYSYYYHYLFFVIILNYCYYCYHYILPSYFLANIYEFILIEGTICTKFLSQFAKYELDTI